MKRDMDLIREILLEIEGRSQVGRYHSVELPDRDPVPDPETVSYHVKMLHDAGLIEATNLSRRGKYSWHAKDLTWEGHEFLDAARNSTVWTRTMAKIRGQTETVPFEVLKAILIKASLEMFGS